MIMALLLGYLFYLFLATLLPFSLSALSGAAWQDLSILNFDGMVGFCCLSAWDIIGNVILFVPFGLLVSMLLAPSGMGASALLVVVGSASCLLSFSVEWVQLVLPRTPSVMDVIANTAGGIVGGLAGSRYADSGIRWMSRCWTALWRGRFVELTLVAYMSVLFVVFGVPVTVGPDFRNWSGEYPIQLANEATMDRAWLGKMYFVALYDRALLPDEVRTNFQAGPFSTGLGRRVTENLTALYDFTEGRGDVVHDRAMNTEPLDLVVRNPDMSPGSSRMESRLSVPRSSRAACRHGSSMRVVGNPRTN